MTLDEIRKHVVSEIQRNVGIIQTAKSEKYDEWAKEKAKTLVDVLDILDECANVEELAGRLKTMFRGAQGSLDALNDLLQAMGQKP